jgi:hypothetical protein
MITWKSLHMTKSAFVFMPFKDPFNGYYSKIYKVVLREAGYSVTRADDIHQPGAIIAQIVRSIRSADLILCDISDSNPNVFYELGLAHSLNKPVIIVCRQEDPLPFDIGHLRVIYYDTTLADWVNNLSDQIKQAIQAAEIGDRAEMNAFEPAFSVLDTNHQDKERVYAYYAERYGWGYDALRVSCCIEPDGSVVLEREATLTAYSKLTQLEQTLHVDPVSAAQELTLDKDQINFASLTSGVDVSCGKVIPLDKGWAVQVNFNPPIEPGGCVTFRVQEKLRHIYAINYSPEQLRAENIKDQWLNWKLDRPTLHFHHQVTLPDGFEPFNQGHRVLFPPLPEDIDDAHRLQEEEQRLKLLTIHIMNSSSWHCNLELDVHLPILGLLYMIRWDPLRRI